MGQQAVRQAARRKVVEAAAERRAERAAREKRLEGLGVEVAAALMERDGAVQACEVRAGDALRAMLGREEQTVSAALEWCGSGLTAREVTRLCRLSLDASEEAGEDASQDASRDASRGERAG